MKYVMTWRKRRHGTTAEYEAGQRRVLDLVQAWRRPQGVTIHQFLVRAGDTGGYAVFETDDPGAVEEATRACSAFHFHIDRVTDAPGVPATA